MIEAAEIPRVVARGGSATEYGHYSLLMGSYKAALNNTPSGSQGPSKTHPPIQGLSNLKAVKSY